jgi:acyl-CoA reductase-like NAD-dependent aldehyde dehydrogenase
MQVKMLIGGQWRAGQAEFEDVDPYRHEVVARVAESTLEDLNDALNAAVAARPTIAAMPAYDRAALLRRVGHLLVERADRIAEIMARETGKAIKDAKTEVLRSQDTITLPQGTPWC